MTHARVVVLFAAQSLLLAGCGSSGTSSSSLFVGSQPIATSAVVATTNDPTNRALQVSATSARASYCAFNFDAAKLKAKYLAYETAQGATPDQMNKIERAYDYTRGSVAQSIAQQPDYCSEHQSAVIKADLARHLTGDYTPSPKLVQNQSGGGLFSGLFEGGVKKQWQGTFNEQTGQIE